MKKENFKIGEVVFFMSANKPESALVESIITIEGKAKIGYQEYKTNEGEKLIVYSAGFTTYEASKVFATLEDLKNSIFGDE